MQKKKIPINYTSRDFSTIKRDLLDYAKRYYPETFQDFNEAGFGALMLDTVAYVGDVLSFYLDYNVNETFLDTATELDNILSIGKQTGFKLRANPSSRGVITFFVLVPANTTGTAIDSRYVPILKKGTSLTSRSGANFMLEEDVNFVDGDAVVARVDATTGQPTFYAVKAYGAVSSGELVSTSINIGEFEKFRRELIDDANITEIVSIEDTAGHEYYEVDFLTQNTIMRSISNRDPDTRTTAPEILKPLVVPRRFVAERTESGMNIQFGGAKEDSDVSTRVLDPSNVALKLHAREYISDTQMDPTRLIESDSMGISPSNTTLTVTYRRNTKKDSNVAARTLTTVSDPILEFVDVASLSNSVISSIRTNTECLNEESITGFSTAFDTEEVRKQVMNSFAAQRRAVTLKDYETMVYTMPPKFGSLRRARAIKNPNPRRGGVNIAVVSEDSAGSLVQSNSVLKENLKVWLDKSRMLTDEVEIVDARVINFGLNFSIVGDTNMDSEVILQDCIQTLAEKFITKPEIGEHFYITDIYKELKDVPGVIDVVDVNVYTKTGINYASIAFEIEDNLSDDGRSIIIPRNAIYEIKFPSIDIKGAVR